MSKKSKFPTLKQEIKTQEAASREIRKLIQGSSGMERWQNWADKRSHGNDTRCLLLIYAMLRGIPRYVSEAKHDRHEFYWIHNGMQCMAAQRGFELSKEAIKEWLNAEAPVAESEAKEPEAAIEETRGAA